MNAFLDSGHERAVIHVLRLHRISALVAAALLVAWFLASRGVVLSEQANVLWWTFVAVLAVSLALKLSARILDRRAMRKDMEILEQGSR